MQAAKLTGKDSKEAIHIESDAENAGIYRKAVSKYGIDVTWYQSLIDVPQGLSCFIAHEFLDALPIHKFQVSGYGFLDIDLKSLIG